MSTLVPGIDRMNGLNRAVKQGLMSGNMDLGTDNCYAGVPLALLRSLTQGARRML